MRCLRFGTLTVFGLAALCAQQFEVASIKMRSTGAGEVHFNVEPNRLDALNLNLRYLVLEAYDVAPFQFSGPEWMRNRSYDIVATTSGPVSKADMRAMLRNLLIERFHLAAHWETKEMAIYHLEVSPRGPRMEATDHGFAGANSPMQVAGGLQLDTPATMEQLAASLSHYGGRPVLDRTNLKGYFKVKLTFASDTGGPLRDDAPTPSLLTSAVQGQLGLKLVPVKEPVKILVIDHADMTPVEN
jgi:uncharacterized protein (TIGR03435 family)